MSAVAVPGDPLAGWLTFPVNHREVIVAFDFFTVPKHLRRLVRDYAACFQEDRIHDALDKDTPRRLVENKPSPEATVISIPRLGGLHHRFSWREAA